MAAVPSWLLPLTPRRTLLALGPIMPETTPPASDVSMSGPGDASLMAGRLTP